MFCTKCGNRYQEDSGFCTNCGNAREAAAPEATVEQTPEQTGFTPVEPPPAPPAEPYYQPPGMSNEAPYAPAPAVALKKKKAPIIPIAIAVTLVAAITIAVVVWVLPLLSLVPLVPTQRAFANFGDEVSQRIAGSPFQSLVIMDEVLQDGAATFVFDFDYRTASLWDPNVDGTITIASDTETFETAIFGEIRVMGLPIDITAVLNRESIAVQSNVVDRDNFYGITFATFPQDMRQFGSLLGLSSWEINEIIDAVQMLENALNADTDMEAVNDAYIDLIVQFLTDMEIVTEDTEIRVGGELVSVSRVGFTMHGDDIVRLLHEMVDLMESDPAVRSYIENLITMTPDGPANFNEAMREIRSLMREFEREFDGSIEFAVYIGGGDRLKQMRIDADMTVEGDHYTLGFLFNLGSSVNDTWRLTVDRRDPWSSDSFTINWDFRQVGGAYENSISFLGGQDNITLASTWNPSSGRFDLSFDDGWMRESFGGHFNITDGGFTLELDRIDIGWGGDTLDLGMSLHPGADIPQVDFINMDRWDWSLIELLERSILGMLLN